MRKIAVVDFVTLDGVMQRATTKTWADDLRIT
jgi:hypothetical protein